MYLVHDSQAMAGVSPSQTNSKSFDSLLKKLNSNAVLIA